MTMERAGSSTTVNEVLTMNDETNGKQHGSNLTPTGRPHRARPSQHLIPPRPSTSRSGPSAVKLWLIKGMVRAPGSSSPEHVAMCRQLPRSKSSPMCTSSTETMAPPETSRLIRTGLASPHQPSEVDSTVETETTPNNSYAFSRHAIRSNYMDKSIEAKKKVIRMLFVVVLEFFVCWAPLHVLNTWYLFSPEAVYNHVGSTGVSLVQLLAYVSSCCNPITYCFMNRKFRQAFLGAFDCYRCGSWYFCCCCCGDLASGGNGGMQRTGRDVGTLGPNNSDVSGNDSTVFAGRNSAVARSEVMVLEAEDRV